MKRFHIGRSDVPIVQNNRSRGTKEVREDESKGRKGERQKVETS